MLQGQEQHLLKSCFQISKFPCLRPEYFLDVIKSTINIFGRSTSNVELYIQKIKDTKGNKREKGNYVQAQFSHDCNYAQTQKMLASCKQCMREL